MRTTILLLLTASLLGGGFFLYWKYQPLSPRLAGDDGTGGTPMGLNPDDPSVQGVGAGQRPWFKVFDQEGRLSSRFRAGVYQPRNDGTVVVKNVEAEFYQYPRPKPGEPQRIQLVKIDGSDGEVVAQQVPRMTPAPAGPPAPGKRSENTAGAPRRGRLNNVVVRLFPDAGNPEPSITLTTNNVAFDNESFEVVTESYRDKNGDVVPADEVPVVVTGDDDGYDFAGRGLKVRWNDVDGRLELLEIAHGDYLKIKKPGKLASGSGRGKGALAANVDSGPLRDPVTGVPVMLATAQKGAPKGAQTRPVRQQPPYRATFDENVRVSQEVSKGEETQLALADIMNVEFMLGQEKPATQPTTQPAKGPSTAPASPATAPASSAGPTTGPAGPTTRPATRPAEEVQPIIVRWTGKLQVRPIEPTDADRAPGLTPGESVLRLVGNSAPVRLTRDLNKVVCAAMDFYTSDGSLLVRNSPKFPQVTLTQAGIPTTRPSTSSGQAPTTLPAGPVPDAAVVVTESIVYSGTERVALLGGRSHAQILLNPDDPGAGVAPGAAPELMDARWSRTGRLYFAQTAATRPVAGKAAGSGLRLDRARFEGDVDVKHPQLALRSQALELAFDPVPASPAPLARPVLLTSGKTGAGKPGAGRPDDRDEPQVQLRRLLASEGVVCDLKDDHGKPQTLACQQLTLETALSPDGKSYPRKVIADGDAHAFDAEQDVKAGQIEIYLIPARKPTPATRPTTSPSTAIAASPSTPPATGPTTAPTTAPTSRPGGSKLDPPAIELQALTARKNVRIVSLDGGSVLADEVYVLVKQDQPHVRLVGAPEAKVVDAKGNTVVGPFIAIDPEQDVARVEGAGWMEVMREESPDSAPRPMKVTWKNGAEVNGPKNIVDVRGPVRVTTTDADGAHTTASANDIRIDLTDAPPPPATQPTTRKSRSSSTQPSTRPAARESGITAGMNVDFLRNKVMRALTLEGNADVRSTLSDADGGVLREFNLRSNERIRYELTGPARPSSPQAGPSSPQAATRDPKQQKGRLVVPGAGQMLVRDHRPPPAPATRPVAQAGAGAAQPAAAKAPAEDAASRRGASAFQWQKDMSYDEATQMAVMNGDVTVVHRSDDAKDPPARLNADQIVAVFEPRKDLKPSTKPVRPGSPQAATRPTTGRATGPAGVMDQAVPLQLKWLTARGNLSVTRGGAMLTAARIDYNPLTQWMTAVGDGRTPAVYTDTNGATTFADELWWNIETWKVKVKEGGSRTGSPK